MKSRYFEAYELVSREDYTKLGDAKVWEIIDPRLIDMIDLVKENFPKGAMYINNWKWGLNREWSGLRTPNSPDWKLGSMHSYGKAADFIFTDYDEAEVREYIIKNPDKFYNVNGVENYDGMSWVHIDVRDREDRIVFTG